MSNGSKNFDWGDVVVWGLIVSIPCALLGGLAGIPVLSALAALVLIPFGVVAALAFLGQLLFTGQEIAKDAKRTFGNGRTFGKRKTTRR